MATRKRPAAQRAKKPADQGRLIRASDVEPEELEYLWLDRIPKGTVTLIGGRPGQGKSLFTSFLARHVTDQGGAVIMSNPEDQLASVKVPRLMAAEANLRLVHFWPGKLRLPTDVEELELMVNVHGVELVTIDPIAKHVVGKDPNSALEPLMAMAERTGCAVVGVHHLNKRVAKDAHPQEAFGGASGGWLGSVRFAHVLGPSGEGEADSRFLGVAKANNGKTDVPSCEFYIDGAEVDLPNGDVIETAHIMFINDTSLVSPEQIIQFKGAGYRAENPEKKAVASEFLTLLLMRGPVPAKTVFDKAAEVGVSKMTVRRAADELGVVKQRIGFGQGSHLEWSLPESHPLAKSIGDKSVADRVEAGLDGQMDVDDVIAQILAEADDD